MKAINTEPYPGQHYWSVQGIQTLNMRLDKIEQGWAHYTNVKTGQSYSCLLPAFLERFRPTAD